MPAPLASAAELNTHLQMTVPDATAELALAGASGMVRSYCGWDLLREDRTFTVVGNGSTLLTLPTLELIAVAEVRIDGLAIDPAGPQPVRLLHGQVYWLNAWPAATPIEVDVTHGYDDIPDVVRLVTLTIAARIVNNPDNYKSANTGTVSRSYDPGLAALDQRLLAPYRLE